MIIEALAGTLCSYFQSEYGEFKPFAAALRNFNPEASFTLVVSRRTVPKKTCRRAYRARLSMEGASRLPDGRLIVKRQGRRTCEHHGCPCVDGRHGSENLREHSGDCHPDPIGFGGDQQMFAAVRLDIQSEGEMPGTCSHGKMSRTDPAPPVHASSSFLRGRLAPLLSKEVRIVWTPTMIFADPGPVMVFTRPWRV